MLEELRKNLNFDGRLDWTLHLSEICSDENLQHAKLYRFGDRLELAMSNSDQYLLAMEEFASRLLGIEKKEEATRLYEIIQDAYLESS